MSDTSSAPRSRTATPLFEPDAQQPAVDAAEAEAEAETEAGSNDGAGALALANQPDPGAVGYLQVYVRSENNAEACFRIRPITKVCKLVQAYVRTTGIDPKVYRFIAPDGQRIDPANLDLTAEALELQDGDFIDVQLEQLGGSN